MSASSERESPPSQTATQLSQDALSFAVPRQSDAVGEILQQILSASERSEAGRTNDPCRMELMAVAAKYSSQEFCLEPVLLELVQVLTRRIKGLSPDRRMSLEKSVARSLFEDQSSLVRLQGLWTHLTRPASHAE